MYLFSRKSDNRNIAYAKKYEVVNNNIVLYKEKFKQNIGDKNNFTISEVNNVGDEVLFMNRDMEIVDYSYQNKQFKSEARAKIRQIKDLEDDLVDQKQLIQFMARGFAGLWFSLPDEIKTNNPYKNNFDAFSQMIIDSNFRLDLESNQAEKIAKIIQDESNFADIVNDEYLSKL